MLSVSAKKVKKKFHACVPVRHTVSSIIPAEVWGGGGVATSVRFKATAGYRQENNLGKIWAEDQ